MFLFVIFLGAFLDLIVQGLDLGLFVLNDLGVLELFGLHLILHLLNELILLLEFPYDFVFMLLAENPLLLELLLSEF